jgi:thiol:disulfide interchange protein DsbD
MKKIISLLLVLIFSEYVSAQMYEPVKWNFSTKQIDNQTIELIFNATIERGWHLYAMDIPVAEDGFAPNPTKFVFDTKHEATLLGKTVGKSKLIEEYDKMFEIKVGFYSNSAVFSQKIKVGKNYKIEGYIKYQACNDEACVSNETPFIFAGIGKNDVIENSENTEKTDTAKQIADVNLDTTNSTIKDIYSPVIKQLNDFNKANNSLSSPTNEHSFWWIFAMGLLGGLIALITPCVRPVIPKTITFFIKRSENNIRARKDATLYSLAIVIIYVTLGLVITATFGTNALNALSTNAIFNVFICILLIIFALSFFGAFEITLPSSWSSKMDKKASSTTGFLSIIFMALTLVIVSFSCTGVVIGFLLVNVTTGDFLAPLIGMLGFAIALAIPFGFFAFFPTLLKSLPKSGGWLNTVKVALAFIELAFALKFLSVADLAYHWHILDREIFLVLWITIFALLGVYLLGKIRFSHDSEQKSVSIPRFMFGLVSLAFALYMIPGLWGAPLKSISAFSPPMNTQDFSLYHNVEAQFSDYELGMTAAKLQKKPVVIDFSGFGCVNCRKMEAAVWTDSRVAYILKNDYVLISLMVDDKNALPEPIEVEESGAKRKLRTFGDKYSYIQRHRFGANAQPFYVILDENGNPLAGSYAFSEDVERFIEFLNFGLENYKKNR